MAKTVPLFFLLLLGSCSQKNPIFTQFSSEYDFNSNKLFSWYNDTVPLTGINFVSTPAIDLKTKEVIYGEMYLRGYNRSNQPGSLIFHHYIIINHTKVSDRTEAGESSNSFLFLSGKISATFILYLVDPRSGQVIWRACTIQELQRSSQNPEEEIALQINALLEVVIPKIFTHFPLDPLQTTSKWYKPVQGSFICVCG